MNFNDLPPSTSSASSSSSNPKYNKYGGLFVNGQPLSTDIRKAIIELSNAGMKQRRISKELKVSQSTISKILSRYKITGSILPDPRGGFRNHNSIMRHSLSRLQQQHQLHTEHLLQNQMSPLAGMHSPGQSHAQQFAASHLLQQQQQQQQRQVVDASQMSMPQLFLQQPMNLSGSFADSHEQNILPMSLRQVRRPPPPPPEPRAPTLISSSTPSSSNSQHSQQISSRPSGRRKHSHVSPSASPPHSPFSPYAKHEYAASSSIMHEDQGHLSMASQQHQHQQQQQQQQHLERLKLPMTWPGQASCPQAVASLFSSSYAASKNSTSSDMNKGPHYRPTKKRYNK